MSINDSADNMSDSIAKLLAENNSLKERLLALGKVQVKEREDLRCQVHDLGVALERVLNPPLVMVDGNLVDPEEWVSRDRAAAERLLKKLIADPQGQSFAEKLGKLRRLYISAVNGRREFRQSFRDEKSKVKDLECQLCEFAEGVAMGGIKCKTSAMFHTRDSGVPYCLPCWADEILHYGNHDTSKGGN